MTTDSEAAYREYLEGEGPYGGPAFPVEIPKTPAQRRELGDRISAARLNAGWSREEAARQAGISPITWKRIEDGLTVQDVKLVQAGRLIGHMELPPDQRQEIERNYLAARRQRSEERMRRFRTENPVYEETLARLVEERKAREVWPDDLDPDDIGAIRAMHRVLHAQFYATSERWRTLQRLAREIREEADLLEAQRDATRRRLRELETEENARIGADVMLRSIDAKATALGLPSLTEEEGRIADPPDDGAAAPAAAGAG